MNNKPVVLVVEDEGLLLLDIVCDLRDEGYEVFEAHNADQAMTILESNRHITVLFTDIDMPGSMNGLQLSHVVREQLPSVKIIITSGMRSPSPSELPANGIFLSKPYQASQVTAAIG
jgi:CheY-like chemotaxis protein